MFAELSGCKLTTAAAGAGVQVRAQAPDVEGNAALNGQVLEVEVAALTDTVGSLKARIAEVGSPPPGPGTSSFVSAGPLPQVVDQVLSDPLTSCHSQALELAVLA